MSLLLLVRLLYLRYNLHAIAKTAKVDGTMDIAEAVKVVEAQEKKNSTLARVDDE